MGAGSILRSSNISPLRGFRSLYIIKLLTCYKYVIPPGLIDCKTIQCFFDQPLRGGIFIENATKNPKPR